MAQTVEAVIISGPRKGEIIHLSDNGLPEITEEDIRTLNAALDDLIAAMERLSTEVRATSAMFQGREGVA